MQARRRNISLYILSDFVFSLVVLILYFLFYPETNHWSLSVLDISIAGIETILSLVLIPLFWVGFYFVTGSYNRSLYDKSRLSELTATLLHSMLGTLLLYFFPSFSHIISANQFFVYFILQFFLIASARTLLLFQTKKTLKRGEVYFKTLIAGNNNNAIKVFEALNRNFKYLGFKTVGFVSVYGEDAKNGLSKWIPHLGPVQLIKKIVDEHQIERVIISIEKKTNKSLKNL